MPILAALSFVFVGLLAYIATRPSHFHIHRKRVMKAKPDEVFALINDFHRWGAWSPWDGLDPDQQRNYSGAERGVGAKYHWLGDKKVGEGRMTITESVENERVVVDLHFIKPFEAKNVTTFTIAPCADGVEVVWAMEGDNNFAAKAFNVFMNMDKMVGADFDKGLASIERAASSSSHTNSTTQPQAA